ncbi:hypothetical protein [Dactylosporangium sp. CA-139066]|uniref:hypothetical protein n=1 Tax=Dactylosporangium sp. CA-139066 TaxID=3239930 RepID=UPI003D8D9A5D
MLDDATLAGTVAAAMVGAVSTDHWPVVRRGLANVLALQDVTRAEAVEQQLERTRAAVDEAGPADGRIRDAHRAAWGARIEVLLTDRPDLADALRAVVAGG